MQQLVVVNTGEMADKRPPTTRWESSYITVQHSLYGAWSQSELGEAFDVSTLSVIGDLDPTGANGVVRDVLAMFLDSLDPVLESIESDIRSPGSAERLRFGVHKLKSAAAQMGALRLASACESVERHLLSHPERAPHLDADLRLLVGTEMAEIIRVQRRLRTLLFS